MRIKMMMMSAFGLLMFIIGTVGIIVPVLPTTPFYLLAFACFAGNPRLRQRMHQIPFFREHIENYQKRDGLRPKTVIVSLCFTWLSLLTSIFCVRILWLSVLLVCIGIAVTAHILMIAKKKRVNVAHPKEL